MSGHGCLLLLEKRQLRYLAEVSTQMSQNLVTLCSQTQNPQLP